MARIKIESVVDHLDSGLRKALERTIQEHFPNQPFDSRAAFRTFKRMIGRKCRVWEDVPNHLVEKSE